MNRFDRLQRLTSFGAFRAQHVVVSRPVGPLGRPPSLLLQPQSLRALQLAGEIRERDALAGTRTPMIALTGYAGPSDFREALQRGFDAHLAKPVDPDSLAVQIAALVRRARRE